MVFSSAVFLLIFLPLVFTINLILPKKVSNIFLLIASLLFYAWGEPYFVLLMIFTIVVNWLIGIFITNFPDKKRVFLWIGVIVDVAILGYFKYTDFLIRTLNSLFGRELIGELHIALPIGISFFTFQAISYIVDVYREDTKASRSVVNVALYIAYFPQLIAGPILKYKEINKQIEDRTITREGVALGFRRFIYGLGKKVIFANMLGKSVDLIFELNITNVGFVTAWLGGVMFALQIYYDFSGYSDMAIGLGKMFGFDIPENFVYPFISRSVTELWRRWHISLGSWFREYVYISLGGNRKGPVRMQFNQFVVFFLTGLWHGASFSYIAWGVSQWFFMVLEKFWIGKELAKRKILARCYLLFVFSVTAVIFRINDLRKSVVWMWRMISGWIIRTQDTACGWYMSTTTWVILILAIIGCGFLQEYTPESVKLKWKDSIPEWLFCILVLILSLARVASDTYNPFIYFTF